MAELGSRRVRATRDRIIALVLAVHTTADRPLGFDQVVALCPDDITRDQARTASAVLCRDGQLERIRSGVYQWADGARAAPPGHRPTRTTRRTSATGCRHVCASGQGSAPVFGGAVRAAVPRGVRMTAELLADFEQWTELTEKLTAYADAS